MYDFSPMPGSYAVVMAGGSGTRFWPLSRRDRPKQLLPIVGEKAMLRETVERLGPLFPPERVFVVVGRKYVEAVREMLDLLPAENIIDEPVGRDTAPCVGLAATFLEWRDPGATFCVLPADHFVGDRDRFHDALRRGIDLAGSGALVTFGVRPRYPATGYGYIEWDGLSVRRFREKPDRATAEELFRSGRHYWNSGIFVWRAARILEEIRRFLPDHAAALERIGAALGTSRLPIVFAQEFERMSPISIDYGVMEKAERVAMIEADFEWDDVGSWKAAAARRSRASDGLTVEVDSRDSLVLSTGDHLVATLGVDGLVVVHTGDATLIVPKGRSEDLKGLVDEIRSRGLDRYL